MRSDNMKRWIWEATQEKDPYTRRWEKLVSLEKLVFREGILPVALKFTTMAIITKRVGEYRYIGLVEVIWEVFV